jgi:F0F1-type ATP synthase membrane subunit b/b'
MKRMHLWVLALALALAPRFAMAEDKGLHLGGLEKDAKKTKIEAKKLEQEAEKDAKKKKKQAEKEAEKKRKAAEKEKKKAEKEAERKRKELERQSGM